MLGNTLELMKVNLSSRLLDRVLEVTPPGRINRIAYVTVGLKISSIDVKSTPVYENQPYAVTVQYLMDKTDEETLSFDLKGTLANSLSDTFIPYFCITSSDSFR